MPIYDYDDDDFYREGGSESGKSGDMKNKYKDDIDGFNSGLDGIQRKRGCTDILCVIIFFAFLVAMGWCTSHGFKHGKVGMITAPIDANNNFCGFGNMKGYPKMFITKWSANKLWGIFKSGLCVKKCPDSATFKFKEGVNCKTPKKGDGKSCAQVKKYYDSVDVGDYCLPTKVSDLPKADQVGYHAVKKNFLNSKAGSFFMDMYLSSRAIYISMAMSIVYSVLFIYLLSWFAEVIAWCCIVLIQIALIGLAAGCYMVRKVSQEEVESMKKDPQQDAKSLASFQKDQEQYQKYLLIGAIVFGILACCFLTCIICARKSLGMAVDVIDASADFVAGTKRVIVVPNFHFVLQIIVFLVWLGATVCVISLNDIEPSTTIPQGRDIKWKKPYFYMFLFMFFGLLWLLALIDYLSRFIVIVAASTYYFNHTRDMEEENTDAAEVCYGFKCAYFHHFGSIAVGSFIIALIRFIKFIFYYVAKKIEKASGDNGMVKCAVKCAMCILNCIEKICDYLNEAAFCYVAVSGESFFPSAWKGFLLNLKHGAKFFFANIIAKVFIFLGKVGITAANVFSLLFIMKNVTHDTKEVKSIAGPVIAVAVVTYFTASLFLGLFETAVMAMLTCLCFDLDMNGGNAKYGPPTFHEKMDKVDKKKVDQDAEKGNDMN